MKSFYLIVSLRLALFPLIFNLSFAQEVEVNTEDSSSGTSDNEVNNPENITQMDSHASFYSAQNDETPMDSQQALEGQKILSPSDSSFTKEQSDGDAQDDENVLLGGKEMAEDGNPQTEDFYTGNEELLKNPQSSTSSNSAPFDKGAQEHEATQDSSAEFTPLSSASEGQDIPNLKITEIFRLGSGEWIEVTNIGDKDFYGELVFSGGKSSGNQPKSVVNIPSYESIIISNSEKIGILSGTISVLSPKSSISDKEAFSIVLLNSGNILDSFSVDKSTVTGNYVASGKSRPSFQKIYNDGREIQITTTGDIYNITGNFIANPGMIIIKGGTPWIGDGPSVYPPDFDDSGNGNNSGNTDNPGTGDNSGNSGDSGSGNNSGNGNQTGGSLDFKLIISEVYYDDDDEWIEIFNIGTGDFFGDIELSGAIFSDNKTSHIYQNINIPANDFIIFADSDDMFGDVSIQPNGGNFPIFSIPDDEEIQISLSFSGQEIDTFFVHKSRVVDRDDYAESFHKIMFADGPIISYASTHYGEENNMSEDTYKLGNPGILYTSADYFKDCGIERSENSDPQDDESLCSDVWEDIVTISEIFRGGNRYDPYVEFSIHKDLWRYYDSLILSGSLLEQPILVNLTQKTETYDKKKLQKNTKLILTTKAGALTEAGLITIILQPDLKFNSFSGELELYGLDGQDRQLLDIVKIGTGSPEKSTYHRGSNHYCGAEMDNVMNFSPGFDESALRFFSVTSQYNEKIVEKVKYVGGGGGCSCPSKKDLCGSETGNIVQTGGVVGTGDTQEPHPDPLLIGEGTGNVVQGQVIKIVSLEPKSPESITLQSFLPYDIDFKNHNYYLKSSTATTKKYIDGILYANTIDTFTKNFGFVDGGACVYFYSGDNQLDSYCYSTEKQQTEKEKSDKNIDSFNSSDYQLSIIDINYDPEGSDSGNEMITIQSKSSKPLDLSKIKMKVNATNKKITGTLEPYSTLTLKGSFGFPNSTKDGSDVVVILFYDNHIFSTYTYNPNKPKIEIPYGAVKVYSVIDGDTFRYRKEDGSLQSVRLLGVDSPESNTARYRTTECFGKEAKNYLTNLIKNQYVTLEYDENSASSDAYGRILAYVYLDGKLVNETLIAEGYAKEYTYKTAYSHQSDFKQAEESAKKSEKGLRSSSTCGKSIEEEPEAWGIDYEKLPIKISNVIYDPDGTDSGNEIVQLSVDNSQISSVNSIDFSDDFSLTIFPRSEYATGTTKNKKLSEFGLFDLSETSVITLKGNFGLPNNRATCVSLNQGSYTFDTWCYNPNGLLSNEETEIQTGDLSIIPDVKIQSIIPNPSGKDNGKEEITLLRTPLDDSPESQTILDLSSDFSLLINGKTKKKLVGNLIPNKKITIKGSFGLPNSASCVSLLYKGEILDEFCYGKAKDGIKFNSDNTSVHEIPLEELAIVKKITLVKKGDKLCVSYNKTLFSCKSIPNSTTEKNKKLLSMQNTYISELEKYIKTNYSMIYYNSEIKDYFELYSDAKKAIKAGTGDFTRGERNISLTDISSLFTAKYEQSVRDYLIGKFQEFLPENISLTLHQLKEKYKQKLIEESDLSFLSYVE